MKKWHTWQHALPKVCVCILPGSFRGMGAFYFKTEIEETSFNTTLLTRITTHKNGPLIGMATSEFRILRNRFHFLDSVLLKSKLVTYNQVFIALKQAIPRKFWEFAPLSLQKHGLKQYSII